MVKGLNFKDWEKISSDKKSTTLKHAKGHFMTIAHAALPKIQQEQLKRLKMAEGGSVDDVPEPNKKNAQAMQAGATQGDTDPSTWVKNVKESLNMAEGGDVNASTPPDPSSDPTSGLSSPDRSTNITINAAPAAPPVAPATAQPSAPPVTQGAQAGRGTIPNQAPPMNPQELQAARTLGAASDLSKAYEAQVPITSAIAAGNLGNEQTYAAQRQTVADLDQAHFADIQKHTDEFAQHIQQIDPDQYVKKLLPGEKVATALGLVLGGMGVPWTHQNPALDFLNKEIDRNVAAQQKNNENQKTIWGAYNNLYNNSNVATNLAKASMNDLLVHKANIEALKQATPQAAQAAAVLGNTKKLENGQLLQNSANQLTERFLNQQGTGASPNSVGGPESQNGGADGSNSFLTPNAEVKYRNLGTILPNLTAGQKQKIDDQYGNTKQAEHILATVPDIYSRLEKQTTASGHLQRALTPDMQGVIGEALNPLIGVGSGFAGALGALGTDEMRRRGAQIGVGKYDPNTDSAYIKNRGYEGDINGLVTDLHTGPMKDLPESAIRHIINTNAPENDDTPALRAQRLGNMIRELRQGVKTDALEAAGMAYKRKKP